VSLTSTSSTVTVGSVVVTGGALSAVSTISMSGALTMTGAGGGITHSGGGTYTITTNGNLALASSAGTVDLTSATTLDITSTAGALTIDSSASTMTLSSDGAMTLTSGSDTVTVEGVVFDANGISAASSIAMTDDLTMSKTAAIIEHTDATGSLTVQSSGNLAISASGTSKTLTMSADGAVSLTSTSSTVTVEDVVFTDGALTGVTSISISGNQVLGAQQTLVNDVGTGNDPGDGTVAAATGSVAALAAECEKLRDWLAETTTQINALMAVVKAHGLMASV